MARFNYADADKYGGQGGAGYFSLKNDGDVARVRFMYNSLDDVVGYAVHQVEIDGKKRYVNCLREYNSPIDDCPFCKARKFQNVKLFIPIYNVDEQKVQVWERGKKFFAKMSSLCGRYADRDNLVQHEFDIERHGAKGDQTTSYEIYEVSKDDTSLADLPELPNMDTLVLEKTAEEMQYYLDNNKFPGDRNSSSGSSRESSGGFERRTPARRRSEDSF